MAAGLGTGLGELVAFVRKHGLKALGVCLGFAAGVILSLSFLGLLAQATATTRVAIAVTGFTVGAGVMLFLDTLLPHMHFSVLEKGVVNAKALKTPR